MSFEELKSLLSTYSIQEIVAGQVKEFPKEEYILFIHHSFQIILPNKPEQFIELMKAWHQIEVAGLYENYTGVVSVFGPDTIFEKKIKDTRLPTSRGIEGRFIYGAFTEEDLPFCFDLKVEEQYHDPKPYTRIMLDGNEGLGVPPLYYWEKI